MKQKIFLVIFLINFVILGCKPTQSQQQSIPQKSSVEELELKKKQYELEKAKLEAEKTNLELQQAKNKLNQKTSESQQSVKGNTSSKKVTASSTLDYSKHSPANVVDGDFGTAWVEGAEGDGYGEWIKISWNRDITVYKLGIVPGYAKNDDIWFKNNRVKTLKVKFSTGKEYLLNFSDYRAMQYFSFPGIKTSSLTFYIDDVYTGWKYSDTCISEIKVW